VLVVQVVHGERGERERRERDRGERERGFFRPRQLLGPTTLRDSPRC
jgi:hypothetical protein